MSGSETALVLGVALALDQVLGEPPPRAHPVVWMGSVARRLVARAPRGRWLAELSYGAMVAFVVPASFAGAAWLLLAVCRVVPLLELVVAGLVLETTFAARALAEAAFVVRDALARDDIASARRGLTSLCSRDPSQLAAPELVAATIESVAENASDSIVAPLLYFLLLGVPAAVAYRAVNTLDAMIGYRGETEWLGKASARLDDLANLVPARLTALLLLAGGWLAGGDVARGWRILVRDGARTASPNAGRPMAAMAGLLRVELEKPGHYRLGDPERPLDPSQIDRAWAVVRAATVVGVVAALALLALGHSTGIGWGYPGGAK